MRRRSALNLANFLIGAIFFFGLVIGIAGGALLLYGVVRAAGDFLLAWLFP